MRSEHGYRLKKKYFALKLFTLNVLQFFRKKNENIILKGNKCCEYSKSVTESINELFLNHIIMLH